MTDAARGVSLAELLGEEDGPYDPAIEDKAMRISLQSGISFADAMKGLRIAMRAGIPLSEAHRAAQLAANTGASFSQAMRAIGRAVNSEFPPVPQQTRWQRFKAWVHRD